MAVRVWVAGTTGVVGREASDSAGSGMAQAAGKRAPRRRRGSAVGGGAVEELAVLLPDLTVVVHLLLPDGHGRLDLVDDVAARLHRVGAVHRGRRHEHARLPRGDRPEPVRHGEPPQQQGAARGAGLADDGGQPAPSWHAF
uniref:Uncharacterized protein n=1 Tax=Oryza glumipatula TaxID=40148 RepID=A0A0D9YSV1_9ORYZ